MRQDKSCRARLILSCRAVTGARILGSDLKQRIQKLLAAAGVASRRHIEEMIGQGRIAVNGKVVYALPVMVDAQHDRVSVDDQIVRLRDRESAPHVYILMNKPKGVYSTNVSQGEQTRAIDLLPPDFPRVYPVG